MNSDSLQTHSEHNIPLVYHKHNTDQGGHSDKDKISCAFPLFSIFPCHFEHKNNIHLTTTTQQRQILPVSSLNCNHKCNGTWWNNPIPLLPLPPTKRLEQHLPTGVYTFILKLLNLTCVTGQFPVQEHILML